MLGNAIRKYGWQSFKAIVLARVPMEMLDAEEAKWIEFHESVFPKGYNILQGGTQIPMHNPEVRAKRAETMRLAAPRKRLSDAVTKARKNRPDWIDATTKGRRERAERERERRMQGMTKQEKLKYLMHLSSANRAKNERDALARSKSNLPHFPISAQAQVQ